MTIKEQLEKLLEERWNSGYRKEVVFDEFADEIIKLIPARRSATTERLYQAALKRELKDKYEEDKYGIHCIACGAYNPIFKKLFHYRRCPTAQIERILSIEL